jgi:Zn finger protein HypA/HybF involved in hydrogenase expression
MTTTNYPAKFICADCGTFQERERDGQLCTQCSSLRVVIASLICPQAEAQLGPDWHAHCFPNAPVPVSPKT